MNAPFLRIFPVIFLAGLFPGSHCFANEPAPNVDTDSWSCNFCEYPSGWFGSLGIGPGYSDGASFKFADYRGITDKGVYLSMDGDLHYLDGEGAYFNLYARNLGLESRQFEMRFGRQGRMEFRLAYREIPKYRGYGTETPFLRSGKDRLTLPPGWVNARTTSGMTALDNTLMPEYLELRRKIFALGFSFRMPGKWRYEVDFQRMEKSGNRAFGAGVFTIQSSHFPAPVEFSTNRIDMGIEYSNKRTSLRFGFSGSSFKNRVATLSWENPFLPVGNTANLRATLEPDSQFYQFNFAASIRLNSRLRFSGRASLGHVTQDDDFTAYSINPDFADLTLPRSSLNGALDTRSLVGRMTARLSQNLSLYVSAKYHDRNNRSPTDDYTPVVTDLVLREQTPNRPYSFERSQYTARLSYLTTRSIGFNAGVQHKDHERTLQSVRKTSERTWWGEVSLDSFSAAQLRLRLETSQRDTSPYRQVSDPGLQENILMRKFHLADRKRQRAIFELDLMPGDRFSAGLRYAHSRDKYSRSFLGLMESAENSVSLDIGFSVNSNLGLQAFISIDNYDSDISSAEYSSLNPWAARTDDRFYTWGFGMDGQLTDKLKARIDYVSSDSRGRIRTRSSAGEAPFPDLDNVMHNARARLDFDAGNRWVLSLLAEHEKYRSTDWQIDKLGADGISAILTMGPESPNYSITLVRLLANYSF